MSDGIPTATHSAELTICGVTLRVHVLDNGERVIEEAGALQLFQAWADGVPMCEGDALALANFVRG